MDGFLHKCYLIWQCAETNHNDRLQLWWSGVIFIRRAADRQRLLQYLTDSQSRSHFLRHENGRPQAAQVFWGRFLELIWESLYPLATRYQ